MTHDFAKATTPLGYKNKKAVGKNHIARVRLYAERFDKALDIYTGEPLAGEELADWNMSNAKRCIGYVRGQVSYKGTN